MKKSVRKRGGNILDEIEPLGEGLDAGIKMLVYGRTGTGKTTFWSSFPRPILVLVCSGIKKSGELRSILTPENRKQIKQWHISSKDKLIQLTQALQEQNDYATVVLDHATGLQDRILQEILGLEDLPAQGSWGMAKQQDWGQCSLQTKEALRGLLNLSGNTVIIAQEREFNTESDNEMLMPHVGAALTPSSTGWLNQTCDYICQTFIRQKTEESKTKIGKKVITRQVRAKGVEYCLRTAPHEVFMTRFRMPVSQNLLLPELITDPNYKKIERLINV